MMLKNVISKTIAEATLTQSKDESAYQIVRLKFTDGSALELRSLDAADYKSWIAVTFIDLAD